MGSLRLRLMLSPPPLLSPAMVTTDTGTLLLTPMDITVTTARDLPMLSPAMVTTDTVTGTAPTDTATAMVMEDTEDTTTVTAMVTVMGTTVEKIQKFMLIQS